MSSQRQTRRVRWVCPVCSDGTLAPARAHKDNVARYCLPCSAQTGKLVARVAPSLERKREQSVARSRQKQQAKRERARRVKYEREHVRLIDAAGRVVDVNVRDALERVCRAADVTVPIKFTWGRRSDSWVTGIAGRHDVRVVIGKTASLERFAAVLAHELAHHNTSARAGHSETWRLEYERIVREAYGVRSIFQSGVAHHRYAIDDEIIRRLGYISESRAKPLIGKLVDTVDDLSDTIVARERTW